MKFDVMCQEVSTFLSVSYDLNVQSKGVETYVNIHRCVVLWLIQSS